MWVRLPPRALVRLACRIARAHSHRHDGAQHRSRKSCRPQTPRGLIKKCQRETRDPCSPLSPPYSCFSLLCFLLPCSLLVPAPPRRSRNGVPISVSTETITRAMRCCLFCANPFRSPVTGSVLLPAPKQIPGSANASSFVRWASVSWFFPAARKAANSTKSGRRSTCSAVTRVCCPRPLSRRRLLLRHAR